MPAALAQSGTRAPHDPVRVVTTDIEPFVQNRDGPGEIDEIVQRWVGGG